MGIASTVAALLNVFTYGLVLAAVLGVSLARLTYAEAVPTAMPMPPMVRPFMGPKMSLPLYKYPSARCLDGTPAAYYILPGDPKLWVIHLHGGGTCTNQFSCNIRSKSFLGSSSFFPLFHSFRYPGTFANTEEVRNKYFAGATMVHVPYCSGDMYSGQTTQPSASTFGLWFSGHHIVDAVITELMDKRDSGYHKTHNIMNASLVVLTGGSAGGMGSVLNLDHVADKIRDSGSQAHVVGAPLAGFNDLLTRPYVGPGATFHNVMNAHTLPIYTKMWNSFYPKRCVAQNAGTEWQCILAFISSRTVNSNIMFFSSQNDMVILPEYYGVPGKPPFSDPARKYVSDYATIQRQAFSAVVRPGVAVFNPACWTHTYLEGIRVQNLTYQEAFRVFLQAPARTLLLQDNCGVNCNPDCIPEKESYLYNRFMFTG